MVPVRVRDEQRDLDRLSAELRRQRLAQRPDARSRIQDDNLAIRAHFHARGIAPEENRRLAGGGNRAAHAPKLHDRRLVRYRLQIRLGLRRRSRLRLPAHRGRPLQCLMQLRQLDRLDQEFIRPGFARTLPVRGKIAPADHDDARVLDVRMFPHRAAYVETVAPRHQQIAQDDIRPVLDGQLHALRAIHRLDHLPIRTAQRFRRGSAANLVVIDQQDRLHQEMPESS
ncbi:MAG: hypothetical protein WDN28_19660 [Chthoniobacter sp.]